MSSRITMFATPGVKAFAEDVDAERQKQFAKWGDQEHPNGTGSRMQQDIARMARANCQAAAEQGKVTWRHILEEEVSEAFAETDPEKLRAELVQSAAVIAAWILDLDRRAGRTV